jgi:hypothetical protein
MRSSNTLAIEETVFWGNGDTANTLFWNPSWYGDLSLGLLSYV